MAIDRASQRPSSRFARLVAARGARDLLLGAVVVVVLLVTVEVLLRAGWVPTLLPRYYRVSALATGVAIAVRSRPLAASVLCGPVYGAYLVREITDPVNYGATGVVVLVPVAAASFLAGATRRTWWGAATLGGIWGVLVLIPLVLWREALLFAAREQRDDVPLLRTVVQLLPVTATTMLVVTTAGAFLLGRAARRQRDLLADLEQRNAELEILRREDAERAAIAERTRIARELHDVVAHHMTAVVVRAQAAVRVAGSRPDEPRAALEWIAETGQAALRATRQAIRMLHTAGSAAPLAPEPRLEDLEDVVRRLREAGLSVDLAVPPAGTVLDPAVELAAVRITQEALTNVLRHAGARHAVARVEVAPQRVEVQVEDDGPGESTIPLRVDGAADGGHGLVGMRERAQALGGTLTVARSRLGGWAVTALLPVDGRGVAPSVVQGEGP